MMDIDSSAVVAIFKDEAEAEAFERAIAADPVRLMSAANVLEAAMVIEARLGEAGGAEFDLWLQKTGVDVVSLDRAHAETARFAWRRFGRGRHQAGLNFGDCFAYALASLTGEPLLFKGDDFSRTDPTTD
jgi:ribonuclease VapC